MDAHVTVRVRSVVIALAVLLALSVGYLVGGMGGGGPVPSAAAADSSGGSPVADRDTIVMSGVGRATGVPDQVSFELSIHAHAADVSAALQQANGTMRHVQRSLHRHGVRTRDLKTTGLSVDATYSYPNGGPPQLTGYRVSEELGVLVRSLTGSGKVITAAIGAGGDAVRMHGLTLRIGNRQALLRKARAKAVADATAKAREYAGAAGERIGKVVSIREVSSAEPQPVPIYARHADAAGSLAAPVPIRAGTSQTRVAVRVEWLLNAS
ncbi:MAG TPA: SIMPL domain-containing protein [Nocardioidaceae bacterium]|nr:SIMPL domain-containing protein [Nocardioidaceae bacterium]